MPITHYLRSTLPGAPGRPWGRIPWATRAPPGCHGQAWAQQLHDGVSERRSGAESLRFQALEESAGQDVLQGGTGRMGGGGMGVGMGVG